MNTFKEKQPHNGDTIIVRTEYTDYIGKYEYKNDHTGEFAHILNSYPHTLIGRNGEYIQCFADIVEWEKSIKTLEELNIDYEVYQKYWVDWRYFPVNTQLEYNVTNFSQYGVRDVVKQLKTKEHIEKRIMITDEKLYKAMGICNIENDAEKAVFNFFQSCLGLNQKDRRVAINYFTKWLGKGD